MLLKRLRRWAGGCDRPGSEFMQWLLDPIIKISPHRDWRTEQHLQNTNTVCHTDIKTPISKHTTISEKNITWLPSACYCNTVTFLASGLNVEHRCSTKTHPVVQSFCLYQFSRIMESMCVCLNKEREREWKLLPVCGEVWTKAKRKVLLDQKQHTGTDDPAKWTQLQKLRNSEIWTELIRCCNVLYVFPVGVLYLFVSHISQYQQPTWYQWMC